MRKSRLGMTFFYSAIVFLLILVTTLLTSGLIMYMISSGRIGPSRGAAAIIPFALMAFVSTLIGTAITVIISRIPLSPIRQMISATKRLASGDFTARISLGGPREFRELTGSFNTMAETLGSLELLRTDFVSNFSHEFKTPIVSLKGYAKLLKSDSLSSEERGEYLDIIISEAERLSALADNVLSLSRIENQSAISDIRPFDLTEQVRRVVLGLEPKWAKKNQNISIELDECEYVGNEQLLYQVWLNLLDNAVKFTQEGGNIDVRLLRGDKSIILTVQDDGPGISEEAKPHIFDKFYQGDVSRATPGNGLGLAICMRIVNMHSGTLHASSREGHGACFAVELPISMYTNIYNK